ncbi:SAM-dependent methyltransferase [Ehrlichia ruminantium]|uniref:SAM-dependent methyltransferase n=1 Tax=Ehrlichia ruminantium TaxID=779 RepID=A0AAE6QBG7_EHRRU|nr:SAM-dependent methyltransferase [Ehrlichia ruminantium]QGR02978.1 SAM-dependent methyltransferase [Ehrlichia ruminantium]QGR03903.1 SAM-dependent methyltransferase [Ehrlichia ruminantium]QGR04827.1 SAM-dependent methyltransferase [Ehrlichia ruminantium]
MHSYLKKVIFDYGGAMSVEQFIRIALYDINYGYYMTQMPFGVCGDFITSPEISQLFGEVIALWVLLNWERIGSPSKFILLELGPGRGTLISDIIRVLKKFKQCYSAVDIYLLEISPKLKEAQRGILQNEKITWCEDIDSVPNYPVLVIANEFFDALPVKQFVCTDGSWYERYVTIEDDKFKFINKLVNIEFQISSVKDVGNPVIEVCDDAISIIRVIEHKIVKNNGSAVIIDYGYMDPPYRSTIQSVKNHKYNNVFENIGNSDITTHVNFRVLKESLSFLDSSIMTQRDFLYSFGIQERLQVLIKNATEIQQHDLMTGFLRLTENMGSMFKVLLINP